MAFLPIAERELRLASRRKSTHRIRVWTTLAGLVVSLFFMLAFTVINRVTGRGTWNLGPILFTLLTFYAYGLSLLAGVVLAADCISEEKREGTLGLLFLTDLKGYDVVFGKLAAVGLSALYGLVAVLPVTALPLLMGGVTGGEFWRVSLALINTLFFSLATGILVSTRSRENTGAMLGTLAILLLAAVALPFLGAVLSVIRLPDSWWYFTAFSPFNPFRFGSEMRYPGSPSRYWYSLLSSHLVAWSMLVIASWTLPRAWQDRPFRSRRVAFAGISIRASTDRAIACHARRSRMLDLNPIAWLSEKNSGLNSWVWILTAAGVIIPALILFVDRSVLTFAGISYIFLILIFVLKIMVAFQACRFFAEARRSGALEMIFSTPLTAEGILQGQWLAMRRLFLWPAVLIFALQFVLALLTVDASTQFVNAKIVTPAAPPISLQNILASRWPILLMSAVSILYKTAKSVADIFAVGAVGMWFALSFKKPNLAVGMTILFVLIIPGLLFCVPDLVIDLVFYLWASSKLKLELKRVAWRQTLVPLGVTGLTPVPLQPPVIR